MLCQVNGKQEILDIIFFKNVYIFIKIILFNIRKVSSSNVSNKLVYLLKIKQKSYIIRSSLKFDYVMKSKKKDTHTL